ncbi:hypothetical protein Q9L58_008918 [Maublancomyces gigas]|uniref:Heterokaryon incompatibility domain-containing protein n=1 Tax=Discina gigas TaxID=1032678 RepID=A0ABR3G8L5_9PEZI
MTVQIQITAEQANKSYTSEEKKDLLHDLNVCTGNPRKMDDPGVKRAINWCIDLGLDFGGAYGRLRKLWVPGDFLAARKKVDDDKNEMERLRTSAFFMDKYGNRTLKHPYAMEPRRIWDLYSHRVIPSYFVPDRKNVWAITHSHRSSKDKDCIASPVNEYQWGVALPKRVTLDKIRDDLVADGAEYCWLDLVCVRQVCNLKDCRQECKLKNRVVLDEEMAVDMPTMGNIYAKAGKVVRYYTGLGRSFDNTEDIGGDYHWLNRAWTLQEMNINTTIGGLKDKDSPVPITGYEFDNKLEKYPAISERLRSLEDIITSTPRLAKIVKAMKPRKSRDDVDKIYGLGYLMKSRTLPAYHRVPNDDLLEVEGTWWQLVYCMSDTMRGELLFLFPQPGDSGKNLWMPTWRQLMDVDMVQDSHIDESVTIIAGRKAKYNGYVLAKCNITGHQVTVVADRAGEFTFIASNTDPKDDTYTLVGNPRRNYFIVCKLQQNDEGELEKVAVIKVTPEETEKVLEWGLRRSTRTFK